MRCNDQVRGVLLDPMSTGIPIDTYREDLAKAPTPERLWRLLSLVRMVPTPDATDEQIFLAAAMRAQASYYIYLLRPTIASTPVEYKDLAVAPESLVVGAHQLLARIHDGFLRDVARFKVELGRHRLARNRWDEVALAQARRELEDALACLQRHAAEHPKYASDVDRLEAEWRFECAHVARYQGFSEESKAVYDATFAKPWVTPDSYRGEVTAHYLVSLVSNHLKT